MGKSTPTLCNLHRQVGAEDWSPQDRVARKEQSSLTLWSSLPPPSPLACKLGLGRKPLDTFCFCPSNSSLGLMSGVPHQPQVSLVWENLLPWGGAGGNRRAGKV